MRCSPILVLESPSGGQVEDLALAFGELAQLGGLRAGCGTAYVLLDRRVIVGARSRAEEAPDLRRRVEACRFAFVGDRDRPTRAACRMPARRRAG
jgi:hypothetical protein